MSIAGQFRKLINYCCQYTSHKTEKQLTAIMELYTAVFSMTGKTIKSNTVSSYNGYVTQTSDAISIYGNSAHPIHIWRTLYLA